MSKTLYFFTIVPNMTSLIRGIIFCDVIHGNATFRVVYMTICNVIYGRTQTKRFNCCSKKVLMFYLSSLSGQHPTLKYIISNINTFFEKANSFIWNA
jgi:hypothetical protein